MPACSVTGAIFGDEGKGRLIDIISEEAEVVVRFQGGNNAGHTMEIDGKRYVTHIIPSGILRDKICAIASGVVLDPRQAIKELEEFREFGSRVTIDPRTQIVMPYHNLLDKAREEARQKTAGVQIGTTQRGMGPVHEDRSSRLGIRFWDLIEPSRLRKALDMVYPEKRFLLEEFYKMKIPSQEEIFDEYRLLGEKLKPRLGDVSELVLATLRENKNVLFEGGQGTLLDRDFGNYPKVTSSHPMTGGICSNVGLPHSVPIYHIGVLKAYYTKVGSGPMPTDLDNQNWPVDEKKSEQEAIKIRKRGREVGATTGRPRRVGWQDLVSTEYSQRVNGFDELALTKLDVLADINPLKIAIAYRFPDGTISSKYPAWDIDALNKCEPVYVHLKGFKNLDDAEAKEYIARIEQALNVPINFVSKSAERNDYSLKQKNWWSK